jgi:DNA (cytosine-5)-methyltransferase 1
VKFERPLTLFDQLADEGQSKKNRTGKNTVTLYVADLFCGAGGFSSGARRALEKLGIEVILVCCNHWSKALDVHSLNHPEANHFLENIALANPRELVPGGYLDILLASPPCTHFSVAKGGKPINDQSRADSHHILKWLTDLVVRRVILENVEPYVKWGPVNAQTGKPIKNREGEYFNAFVEEFRDLGYSVDWRILTACDYGDGTTRKRFFLQARNDGHRIIWPEPTHGEPDLLNPNKKPFRVFSDFHQKEIPGKSIFDRKKPLALNTNRRVATGLLKFNGDAALPYLHVMRAEGMLPNDKFSIPSPKNTEGIQSIHYLNKKNEVIHLYGNPIPNLDDPTDTNAKGIVLQVNQGNDRSGLQRPIDQPMFTIVTRESHGVAIPTSKTFVCGNRNNNTAKNESQPIPTVTTAPGGGMFVANTIFDEQSELIPMLMGQQGGATARPYTEPVPTVSTDGYIRLFTSRHKKANNQVPFLVNMKGQSNAADYNKPTPTITASVPHLYLGEPTCEPLNTHRCSYEPKDSPRPFILNRNGGEGNRDRSHSTKDPIPTATCRGAGYLVDATLDHCAVEMKEFITPFFGSNAGLSSGADSTDEPLSTITSQGNHHGFCQPTAYKNFIVPQFGERPTQTPRTHAIDEPLPAPTSHGAGALVNPIILQIDQTGSKCSCTRSTKRPIGTIVTKNNQAIVEPTTHPFIVSTRHVNGGPTPRSTKRPIPAITAGGSQTAIVEPLTIPASNLQPRSGRLIWINGHPFVIDILFRMLTVKELASAMSFTDDEHEYLFQGTQSDQIKMIGNAVPVKTAANLVAASIYDIVERLELEAAA